ncbi:rhamnogalacturonan acetylesterase [Flavobacterium cellulosilyticum]|uniref:Rhamnogalacturonan acetylesterase n=1 Tax=Flavobacterium cellulosilyticum TaxID=2541731 RepID=A0A4R5C7J8_9FLAO|nr:rhamnogalacturonan acetylesterase [Flavobacterium cellulosilyticum]TDD94080.1 rhamnogalacturonan acetylesterase [Flavobacterium cellulosilyticum]
MKRISFLLVLLISLNCFAQKPTIYGIGDSTMANKVNPNENPERGWGQMVPLFLSDKIQFDNRAVNGRSTRSFINEKLWDAVYNKLKPGDYVFIQFGHNDAKEKDSLRYTNPHTAYRHNLIRFVTETREKGATPIIFSSIIRRNFNEVGVLIPTHGDYTLEARLVAQELNVPFIDMEYYTELLEQSYGPEKSKKLHLHYKAGEIPYYKEDKADDTHLCVKGATEVAKIAINELMKTKLELVNYIKN